MEPKPQQPRRPVSPPSRNGRGGAPSHSLHREEGHRAHTTPSSALRRRRLIPVEQATEVLKALAGASAGAPLCRTTTMSAKVKQQPVLSALPLAYWVRVTPGSSRPPRRPGPALTWWPRKSRSWCRARRRCSTTPASTCGPSCATPSPRRSRSSSTPPSSRGREAGELARGHHPRRHRGRQPEHHRLHAGPGRHLHRPGGDLRRRGGRRLRGHRDRVQAGAALAAPQGARHDGPAARGHGTGRSRACPSPTRCRAR